MITGLQVTSDIDWVHVWEGYQLSTIQKFYEYINVFNHYAIIGIIISPPYQWRNQAIKLPTNGQQQAASTGCELS